jgi:hypothetical protein
VIKRGEGAVALTKKSKEGTSLYKRICSSMISTSTERLNFTKKKRNKDPSALKSKTLRLE